MKTPILGESYVARSLNAADARMINLFPEVLPEGKEAAWLQRAPGLRLLATVGVGPIRGLWTFNGVGYVVSGNALYSINSTWTPTLIGAIAGSGPVSMADNGTQMFIACNGTSYIYNASTLVLAAISDPDFPGAVTQQPENLGHGVAGRHGGRSAGVCQRRGFARRRGGFDCGSPRSVGVWHQQRRGLVRQRRY